MGLGICFNERYESITCHMYYSTDTNFTSCFAMLMIVLQNIDRLSFTLAGVFNISGVKVTVIAIVSANWTDTLLFA
jgi:hypothetical protein